MSTYCDARNSRFRHYLIAASVLLLGLALTLVAFWGVRKLERQTAALNFSQTANQLFNAVQTRIGNGLEVLSAVNSLFISSKFVDRDEFHTFTQPLLARHPYIRALSYNKRIHHSERPALEAELRQIFPDFAIKDPDANGRLIVPAPEHDHYVVVYYLEPYRGNEVALGVNNLSVTDRLKALTRATDTGAMSATRPMQLVMGEKERNRGFMLFMPYYRAEMPLDSIAARRENVDGYTVASFRIYDMIADVYQMALLGNANAVTLRIYDQDIAEPDGLLFDNTQPIANRRDALAFDDGILPLTKTVDVAGRNWVLVASPVVGHVFAGHAGSHVVLVIGLLGSVLLAAYLHTLVRRGATVEELVVRRTAEVDAVNIRLREEIHNREMAEHGLRASAERMQMMIENTHDAFFSFYAVGTGWPCTAWNRKAELIFGWSRDEVLGRDLVDLIIPERFRAQARLGLQSYSETGKWRLLNRRTELIAVRRDGHEFPIESTLNVINVDEKPLFGAFMHDITERKRTEQALRESSERLHLALEASRTGTWTWDIRENSLVPDEYIFPLLGLAMQPGDCLEAFMECVHPDDREMVMRANRQAVDHGVDLDVECRVVGADGAVRHLVVRGKVARDQNGEPVKMAGVSIDITERKEAEEKIRQRNAELTQMNARMEEAQHQLLQSERMASVGQLAAGVAHEINNPIGYVSSNLTSLETYLNDLLQVLTGYEQAEGALPEGEAARIQLLKKQFDLAFLKEDIQSLLGESKEGVTRVKQIVQDLKDFSRVDTSEEWHWADLHKGIDSTLNIVWNDLKYKATVNKEYGNLPEIECIPSQLNQVFLNLLVNASHAIETRGTITISSGIVGEEIFVAVGDTGKGIAPEHLKKIFDPFFTTKPIGKGTGLGLSLSYGIVKKHHGRIEVQSDVGKGTTFTVWLPKAKSPDPVDGASG